MTDLYRITSNALNVIVEGDAEDAVNMVRRMQPVELIFNRDSIEELQKKGHHYFTVLGTPWNIQRLHAELKLTWEPLWSDGCVNPLQAVFQAAAMYDNVYSAKVETAVGDALTGMAGWGRLDASTLLEDLLSAIESETSIKVEKRGNLYFAAVMDPPEVN